MIKVLIPVQDAVETTIRKAPRLTSVSGKVIGLYSNGKLNASRLLEMIAEELRADGDFTIKLGKYHPDKMMAEGEWSGIDECDAIILANGDCGACSSSGLANAIDLESRGVPALLISTPPFTEALNTMARLRGMPDAEWATVPHPIGSLSEDELRSRAVSAAEQFRSVILAPAAPQRAAA